MSELPEFRERGIAAVRLLQGVIYEADEEVWSILLSNESDLTDYFCQIGLVLVVDRGEGIAYLRQFGDDERTAGIERLPKLFRKTPLGYEATLLCVLLRDEYRKFEEEDLDNERSRAEVRAAMHVGDFKRHEQTFEAIRETLGEPPLSIETLDARRRSWETAIHQQITRSRAPLQELGEQLVNAMARFLKQFHEEQDDLDASIKTLESFLGLLEQLRREDRYALTSKDPVTNHSQLFSMTATEYEELAKQFSDNGRSTSKRRAPAK